MTPEAMELVKEAFSEALYARFPEGLVFDPIIIKPFIDYWGDGDVFARALIVVDGDTDLMLKQGTYGLLSELVDKLEAQGVKEFPSPWYIDKEEYLYYLKRGKVDSL